MKDATLAKIRQMENRISPISKTETNPVNRKQLGNLSKALIPIISEYLRATEIYPPMNTAHEGWALIMEEMEELKQEVFKKPSEISKEDMKREAVQIAAMAIRFITDVCERED